MTLHETRDSGMVGGLRLSVTEAMAAFAVPRRQRPRWIRLLVAMEQTLRAALRTKPADKGDAADG